jgi:hypothetical protein
MSLLHCPNCIAKISQCHTIFPIPKKQIAKCLQNKLKGSITRNEQQNEDKCLVPIISNVFGGHLQRLDPFLNVMVCNYCYGCQCYEVHLFE